MVFFTQINYFALVANLVMSIVGYFATKSLIAASGEIFIKANLFGIDLCKSSKNKLPESQGVLCSVVFLIIMFLFTPVPFLKHFHLRDSYDFPFHEYVEFLAAIISICCMSFLGFADDVFDLKWRHKLLLPTIASLPLLTVYLVTFDLTTIIVPYPLRPLFGYSLNIGLFYYLYMGMLAVFCTNSINIMAGINGIEVGQTLVIIASVIVFNLIELYGEYPKTHEFSLYLLIPLFAVSFALYYYNKYPAKVFVGDTYCYFAGMSLAVVGILGHFGKTVILFFLPQTINFLYSVPQLFKILPCPRHRLPKYNAETDKLEMSVVDFKGSDVGVLGQLIIKVASSLKLLHYRRYIKDNVTYDQINNMTLINLLIFLQGPTHERTLTNRLLILQISFSIVALTIRYPLARLFYDV